MVEQWAWIIWLALILIFVVIEMFTLEFTFLMLGIASLGGLGSGLAGAPWWLQLIVAAVLALVLILTVRPPLLRALRKGEDPAKSNIDALIGLHATVLDEVTRTSGRVRLANGETWTARLAPTADTALAEGTDAVVASIDGATARVVAEV